MSDAGLSIIAIECKSACAGEPDLEKRIRKSMAVVANGHWMFCHDHQDDLRFRGALGGAMLAPETTEDDKARISASLKLLRTLSAAINGVPVDFTAALAEKDGGPEPLPLIAWWHEAKADKAA